MSLSVKLFDTRFSLRYTERMIWRGGGAGAMEKALPNTSATKLPTAVFLTGTKSFVVDRILHDGQRSLVLSAFAEYPFGILRSVALKFGRSGAAMARLRREATALTRVRHPSLMQLLEYGVDSNGEHVLVFDAYDGISLATWLAHLDECGARVPKAVAVLIALRVFEALHALHLARDPMTNEFSPIVHGNVTTENLHLSWDGSVRLHDLGSSNVLAREAVSARTGKDYFDALEQDEVMHGNVRFDVYAACRLLQNLIDRPASPRKTTNPLSFGAPEGLSARLDGTLARGLHPEAELRNLSAADMLTALRSEGCSDVGQRTLIDLLRGVRSILEKSAPQHRPSGVVPVRAAATPPPDAPSDPRQEADTLTPPPNLAPAPDFRFENADADTDKAHHSSMPTATGLAVHLARIPPLAPPPSFDKIRAPALSLQPLPASSIPPPLAFAARGSLPSYSSIREVPLDFLPRKRRGSHVLLAMATCAVTIGVFGGIVWRDQDVPASKGSAAPARTLREVPHSRAASTGMIAFLRAHEVEPAPALPGVGYVRTLPEERGHRIFVDGKLAGGGGGSLAVSCGIHAIRVGSSGTERRVQVPCGDEVHVSR